jgi:hypothetical protein
MSACHQRQKPRHLGIVASWLCATCMGTQDPGRGKVRLGPDRQESYHSINEQFISDKPGAFVHC